MIIGGDGLFSQYINACYNHRYFETLVKLPVAILPGGSSNSLSCDTGASEPLHGCINILRGITIKGDIMKIDFEKKEKSVLATVMAWGFASEILKSSQKWRSVLGTKRYVCCGVKEVLCHGGACKMRSHQIAKSQYIDINDDENETSKIDFSLLGETSSQQVSLNIG